MNEEQGPETWDDDPDVMLERPEPTGLPRVDGVVDGVARVGSLPVEEHVRVYEQAHVELRAVLDDPDAAALAAGPA